MANEEYFETEKYLFWYYQEKRAVVVRAITIERRNFTDQDESELKAFLNDMGKWENFIKAGKNLLEDLGINTKTGKEHQEEFGIEKYVITKFEKKDERLTVTIELTSEESLRRTRGDSKFSTLPIEEIREQLKNVPKWQTLKKTLSELKEKL